MTRRNKHAARFGVRYRIPGGETYLPVGFNIRRFGKALREVLPIIRRISEGLRNRTMIAVPSQTQPGRMAIVPTEERWTFAPDVANPAAPTVAELQAGTVVQGVRFIEFDADGDTIPAWQPLDERYPEYFHEPPAIGSTTGRIGGRVGPRADILDRIDDTLLTYDSQHADGDQPWPYRGF